MLNIKCTMKTVLFGGVFDIIHPGHVHALEMAKSLGDRLVVVVASDQMAAQKTPLHDAETRQKMAQAIRYVDRCVIGYPGDIYRTVSDIKPDVIAIGYNQRHDVDVIKQRCKEIGLPNISVTRLTSNMPNTHSRTLKNLVDVYTI